MHGGAGPQAQNAAKRVGSTSEQSNATPDARAGATEGPAGTSATTSGAALPLMPMLHKGVCTFLTQRGTPVPAPASAAFSLSVYLQNGKQDGEYSSPAKGTCTEHKLCPPLAMKTGNINIWKALKERPYPTLCVMKTGKYCHQAWLWKQSKLKRLTMEQKLSASRSSLQVCHETQKESFASLVL